jgi:hypothetical protein
VELVYNFLQANSESANVSIRPDGQYQAAEGKSEMRVFLYVLAAGTKRRHLKCRNSALQVATSPEDKCPCKMWPNDSIHILLQMQFILTRNL